MPKKVTFHFKKHNAKTKRRMQAIQFYLEKSKNSVNTAIVFQTQKSTLINLNLN